MKSVLIFTAFTSAAPTSTIQIPNLMDRAIDPATMNPTLFSVLSVLKTGMPMGPNVPMPTGDFEPDWYQKLPGDVKSLLPSFYPVATSEAQVVSQVAAIESSVVMTPTEGVTSTGTVVYASTATDAVSASSVVQASDSTSPTTSFATQASASATPSSSLSTGARLAAKTETLAVVAWLSVGAGFFIFA